MKKLFFFICIIGVVQYGNAQGFGASISAGYLSEIESIGASGDLVYEFDSKWGVSTNATFTAKEFTGVRVKWFVLDLNGRYKVIDELYVLAGGEYLKQTVKALGLGGGTIGQANTSSGSEYGINLGTGYKYNIVDNINIFAEVKYVIMDVGYLHARAGLHFDF